MLRVHYYFGFIFISAAATDTDKRDRNPCGKSSERIMGQEQEPGREQWEKEPESSRMVNKTQSKSLLL